MSLSNDSHSCGPEEMNDSHIVTSVTSACIISPHSGRSRSPPRCLRCPRCFKNPRSKGAFLILLWNVIIGFLYGLSLSFASVANQKDTHPFKISVYYTAGILGAVSFGQMLMYPLGGILADLWFGCYKILFFSGIKITLGFIFLFIVATLYTRKLEDTSGKWEYIVFYFFVVVSALL